MSDRTIRELRSVAESAESYGDSTAAIRSAQSRRRRQGAVGVLLALGLGGSAAAVAAQPPPLQASFPTPARPTVNDQSDPSLQVVTIHDPSAPVRLLYRTCGSISCTAGLTDNTNQHLRLPAPLQADLSLAGLDDVTLSPDGEWIGLPHEDGAFTVVQAFNVGVAVEVPAGPPGSRWAPYFWSAPDDQHLVLAQHTGTDVTGFAVVDVSRAFSADPRVTRVAVPRKLRLIPQSAGKVPGEQLDVASPPVLGESDRPHQAVEELLVNLGGRSEPSPGETRDLSSCLRETESVLGPNGVPMTFAVPSERSNETTDVTIVFTVINGRPVPSGVVSGGCPVSSGDAVNARYDLPITSVRQTWRFLGPVTATTAVLSRHVYGSPLNDLVLVGAGQTPTVVGTVPRGTTVVAPGMTGGFFE